MENCNCHNEINLKGSGQLERYLKALDPAYVSIDGRSTEDLLNFAAGYAEQIRFYDMPDSPAPDDGAKPEKVSWAEFFKRDMAVIAASIAQVNLAQIKADYDAISNQLQDEPSPELFTALFDEVIKIAAKIDNWYTVALPQNPLFEDLDLAINSSLRSQLKKAISYEEGFIIVDSKTVLNIDYGRIANKNLWGLNDDADPDFEIYQGLTAEERILNAALYVDDIFHAFYGAISNIVEQSPSYVEYALTQYPAHQPYMALFIAFIKLFSLAQQQMNGLTDKMLNFYYRDVLHLAEKPAVPDKVFVVFELAKNVAEYDLAKGTALSAGKDNTGKEQVYKTEDGFVINQAKVKELKNIFIEKTPAEATEEQKTIATIYAKPVANSKDGYGEKFTEPGAKWPTFGNSLSKPTPANMCDYINNAQIELNSRNEATVGFALASPQLLLQGGNRLVGFSVPALSELLLKQPDMLANVQIALSGEKGWLTIDRQITDATEKESFTRAIDEGIFDPAYTESGFFVDEKLQGIYLYISIAEAGIVGFDAKVHTGHTYKTNYPVMEFLIGPEVDIPATVYNTLRVNDVALIVKVGSINPLPGDEKQPNYNGNFDGLKNLIIQTDAGVLPAGKPFDPFSAIPAQGSSFYVGSDEVFNKPLGYLSVNINKTQSTANTQFAMASSEGYEYGVSVLYNRTWKRLCNSYGSDFRQETLTINILNEYTFVNGDNGEVKEVSLARKPIEYFDGLEINADKGFLKIDNLVWTGGEIQDRLNRAPEFQIKEISVSYLSVLRTLEQGIDQVFHIYPFGTVETGITVKPSKKDAILAGDKIVLGRRKIEDAIIDKLIVNANNLLLPQFTWVNPTNIYKTEVSDTVDDYSDVTYQDAGIKGGKKLGDLMVYDANTATPGKNIGDRILAKLMYDASGLNDRLTGKNNQYSGTIQEEGMLFIGLEKLVPLQTLSLLFEFAPGSAVNEDDEPPAINWSYLTYNEWRPLNVENLVSDSTYGFQTTGIVKLDVPADANDSHTIITDGLYWFCASVTTNADRIAQLIDVIAQATEAEFFDQDNSSAHYDNALPAGSISKLSVAVSQVSKVQQPFASFDGKHREVGKEYYTRVSERLRHKGRAITAWDYEHLVLDKFPSVFKVKCIPNTDPRCFCRKKTTRSTTGAPQADCCGPVRASGHVLVVPVPNLKNNNAANPLQPKTSRLTLIEIAKYLRTVSSPFVKVHVKNPVYEQVLVFFRVKFLSGVDKGYHLKKLNQEIVEYLTPWAFDEKIEADFGQKIYASAIITFIEQRPYVDFITDFLMGVCRDECCGSAKAKPGEVTKTGFIESLDQVTGCNDIEHFLNGQGYFVGDVIAQPSTQLSLLVSAPHHIILPFEDKPVQLTPCEKRKAREVPAQPAPEAPKEEPKDTTPPKDTVNPEQPTWNPSPKPKKDIIEPVNEVKEDKIEVVKQPTDIVKGTDVVKGDNILKDVKTVDKLLDNKKIVVKTIADDKVAKARTPVVKTEKAKEAPAKKTDADKTTDTNNDTTGKP
ncbi:hypothetical protein [Mucilaginibacter gynuensis]